MAVCEVVEIIYYKFDLNPVMISSLPFSVYRLLFKINI